MLTNSRGFVKLFKISISQHYPYSLPFFQKYYNHPIYFPSFHQLLRLIIFLFPKKVVRTSILRIQIKNYVKKIELQMIRIHPLKRRRRKDVKEDPNSVANEKFHCLVANGRFQCFVAFERFQCLVAFERF